MRNIRLFFLLFCLIASVATARPSSEPRPVSPSELVLELSPQAEGDVVKTLGVRIRLNKVLIASGDTVVQLPLMDDNVDTAAEAIDGIEATDAHGTVQLSAHTSTMASGDEQKEVRVWTASRALSGALTLRYRVPATAIRPPRGPAEPISFRNDDHAFSGASSIFLVLPPAQQSYALTISWDLSHLPPPALGISSLGNGTATLKRITSDELGHMFFMAGKVGRWPQVARTDGFSANWQGQPPFDAAELSAWVGRLHQQFQALFPQPDSHPYTIFLRYNPINAGGGVALYQSFVVTYGAGQGADPNRLKITLSHEMFHTYQPHLAESASEPVTWFTEGLAMFAEARLPLRFGMITPEQFLQDLNRIAGRYYTNALRTMSNAEAAGGFWKDTRIRMLAYDRGMLYLATVDDAVRKRSGGKRSLDDLERALLKINARGATPTQADWETLLAHELGASGVADFHAFLAGTPPLPASDAFGPCFRRTSKPLREYVLGFEPAVLAESKRIVRGLVEGSAAALAGVRNGDEIVLPVPQDDIQGNQTQHLHLRLRRDGRQFDVDYLPRGKTMDAWQWERVDGVADDRCAL
ncbi:peptidase M61 [Xanthomonas campestris]|uniref:peptidase M61 n=1 Tax=Xanthomonas campestris TaxID=339 RepID=UPI001E542CAC|nr:peptidase M61 [Xanthomonas campestris]MCC5074381.1 peptidase M61 [Xanthomonas campestris pv. plantaginis]